MNQLLNAFTVDVEDYFQVSAFDNHIRRDEWERFPSRVVASTRRLLELLESFHVSGTFFVLGWVARRYPQLVREIHSRGHEIASHGFWHHLVYEQTPDAFRQDIRASRDVLQNIIGQPIKAYRAPSFSITKNSLWALEILVEEGFSVDSSIFPVYHDRYGIPDAPPHIHQINTPAGALWEFPPSVAEFGKLNVPVGGGYFRLYPATLTRSLIRRIQRHGRPAMFYIHPWELDPGQPRLAIGSWRARRRHYLNLGSTSRKLESLLGSGPFGTISTVLSEFATHRPDGGAERLPHLVSRPSEVCASL